ncbi:tyrosine recombinase XerC [Streptomyces sp. NPDC021019]|uniref:tyrosine recombinase XerC n=1 Tax=Streptomyces sp. NPDC021019 TaxID=3365108 RepID=UPI00379C3463
MAKPKKNANNEGTIYQRKDGRWEGSAYVLTTDGTYKRRSRVQQIADQKAAGHNWKGTGQGLVFTTKNGTPIEPRNLNRSFEALSARAGVRKVRFHDLRHTCASLLHEQGADARMIMEVLGHSSIRVTMDIYTFVRLDSQRSAFDRVGDALRGDNNQADDDSW